MKTTELKKFIKEAVREAIQEELKDILLEAVKSPKQIVRESYTSTTNPIQPSQPTFTPPTMDLRSKYSDVLGETALSFTSQDITPFRPQVSDPINGNLGTGEVGMDQIMNLLNNK
jgi:hypothetical protein